MLLHQSVLGLLPCRVRRMLNHRVHIGLRFGGNMMALPLGPDGELECVMWTPSWKSELIRDLFDPKLGTFIDIGANAGQTLLDALIAQPGASYIGFEPNTTCVNYLRELIKANAFQDCLIIPVGLADMNLVLPLFRQIGTATDECSTILPELRPDREYVTDFVPCFRFDDIRAVLPTDQIAFVKVDVEGAELEVLTGMRVSLEEFRPLVLCEVLFTDSKADLQSHELRDAKLMQLLEDIDYQALQLIKTADNDRVVNVNAISSFPSAYWTLDNQHLCDYLFVPKERVASVLSSLSGSESQSA